MAKVREMKALANADAEAPAATSAALSPNALLNKYGASPPAVGSPSAAASSPPATTAPSLVGRSSALSVAVALRLRPSPKLSLLGARRGAASASKWDRRASGATPPPEKGKKAATPSASGSAAVDVSEAPPRRRGAAQPSWPTMLPSTPAVPRPRNSRLAALDAQIAAELEGMELDGDAPDGGTSRPTPRMSTPSSMLCSRPTDE